MNMAPSELQSKLENEVSQTQKYFIYHIIENFGFKLKVISVFTKHQGGISAENFLN